MDSVDHALDSLSLRQLLKVCEQKYVGELAELQKECFRLRYERDVAVKGAKSFIAEEREFLESVKGATASDLEKSIYARYTLLQENYLSEIHKKNQLKAKLACVLKVNGDAFGFATNVNPLRHSPKKQRLGKSNTVLGSSHSSNLAIRTIASPSMGGKRLSEEKINASNPVGSPERTPRKGRWQETATNKAQSVKRTPSPKEEFEEFSTVRKASKSRQQNLAFSPPSPVKRQFATSVTTVSPSSKGFALKRNSPRRFNPSIEENLFVNKSKVHQMLVPHRVTARSKAERSKLHATDCPCCKDYFELVGTLPAPEGTSDAGKPVSVSRRMHLHGRHRVTYKSERSPSPEDFWQV